MGLKFSEAGANECIRTNFKGFCLTPKNKKVRAHWKFEICVNFLSESDIQVTYIFAIKFMVFCVADTSNGTTEFSKTKNRWVSSLRCKINKYCENHYTFAWSASQNVFWYYVYNLYVICMSLYVTLIKWHTNDIHNIKIRFCSRTSLIYDDSHNTYLFTS